MTDTFETRSTLRLPTVTATRYVTPLREGGSLPALMEASDDGLYVMKLRGAAQGPKTLIAELVAGQIGRLLGLNVPQLVIIELPAALPLGEPDPEIKGPMDRSIGPNLGLDYLPGALPFDPAMRQPVDPVLAASIVWFDALIANVDRTSRNPNLLRWHGELWLIDHGAALYPHHRWTTGRAAELAPSVLARRPFPQASEHVLLPVAASLVEADQRLAPLLDETALWEAIGTIPDAWLEDDPGMDNGSPSRVAKGARGGYEAQREAYMEYLTSRLRAPRPFIAECERLRLDKGVGTIDPERATRGRRRE